MIHSSIFYWKIYGHQVRATGKVPVAAIQQFGAPSEKGRSPSSGRYSNFIESGVAFNRNRRPVWRNFNRTG
ncbi:hypothetical protein, partial [Methylomonas rivi]